MTATRWLFLFPAALLPASLLGLTLYYLVTAPTKNDFYVGQAGAATGVVLLLDLLVGVVGLGGFAYSLWAAPVGRLKLCLIAVLSALAFVAAYGLSMQVLRFSFGLHT